MVQAEKHSAGWYFKRYLLMGFFALAVLVSLVVSDKTDAFASTSTFDFQNKNCSLSVSDDILAEYPYVYVREYSGHLSIYVTSEKLYVIDSGTQALNIDGKKIAWCLYNVYGNFDNIVISSDTARSNFGTWYELSTYNGNSGSYCVDFSNFVFSNVNINYATYNSIGSSYTIKPTSFFLPTEVRTVEIIQELPGMVRVQAVKIIPVAVGCLALLIGCLTLLPKLRHFLV